MSTDLRKTAVHLWWSNAQKSLDSAKRELEADAYTFAINRIYYAAFYAVTAALIDRKLSFKRHAGVRTAFHKEFIKTNLLNNKWSSFYDRLFDDRQEGDYVASTTFERKYVEDQLKHCKQFLSELKPLISLLSNG